MLFLFGFFFFFFKQKTAYEMVMSDWSSDVCSSDLALAEGSDDERGDESAHVDAHVEDREACVASHIGGIVQRTDHRADVRLQQTCAHHDQRETEVKGRQGWIRETEVPERDDDAAPQHAAELAKPTIGDDAAGNRRRVDAERVPAIDGRGVLGRETESAPRRGD